MKKNVSFQDFCPKKNSSKKSSSKCVFHFPVSGPIWEIFLLGEGSPSHVALRLYRFNCGGAARGKWWGKTPWDGTRKIFNPIKTPFVVGNWVYPRLKDSNSWGAPSQQAPTYDFYQIHQVPSTRQIQWRLSTSILEVVGRVKSWALSWEHSLKLT